MPLLLFLTPAVGLDDRQNGREQKWRQRGGRQRRKLPKATPARCKPGWRGQHGPRFTNLLMLATAIIQNATPLQDVAAMRRFRRLPRLRKRPEISAAAFSFIMHGLSFVRYISRDGPTSHPARKPIDDGRLRRPLAPHSLAGGLTGRGTSLRFPLERDFDVRHHYSQ